MTTHGVRSRRARLWLGSITIHWCAQMTFRSYSAANGSPSDYAHPPSLKKILVPLDGSSLAEQILEPALVLGELMQAEYTLLRVVKPAHFASFSSSSQIDRLDREINPRWRLKRRTISAA